MLFTDTDSLCYAIETDDVYEDFLRDRELFDNSDYKKYSKFYFYENKKVIGKFKDEAAGHPITEFVGLKSKTYCYVIEGKIHKTAKGVKKNNIKRDLRPGSDAVLHMSRIEFEFRPTQINLDRLN